MLTAVIILSALLLIVLMLLASSCVSMYRLGEDLMDSWDALDAAEEEYQDARDALRESTIENADYNTRRYEAAIERLATIEKEIEIVEDKEL